MANKKRFRLAWFIAGILVAGLATLAIVNLTSGGRKVGREIAQDYGISDPQFVRSMGMLLGPPLL